VILHPGDFEETVIGYPTVRAALAAMVAVAGVGICTAGEVHKGMSYIENGRIRLGANLDIGGAITHLSTIGGPNMINSHDWGRQIQMSFYSGPVPFVPEGATVSKNWKQLGWNPIQSGDCYGNGSRVIEHRNDGKVLYVRCIPMQWPLKNVPGECEFECWFRLEGNLAHVRSRLTNKRPDKTQYPARTQELPAVYTNGPWYKLVSYQGDRPFTGAEPTVLVDKGDGKGWPWRNFYSPEHWIALLDARDTGLGLYLPGACGFIGGFAGGDQKKGSGGPKSGQTGYMGVTIREILDHNILFTYDYTLIVGSLTDIRNHVNEREKKRTLPRWAFKNDRQHWTCQNTTDDGWPIRGALRVQLGPKNAVLVGPRTFWRAEDARALVLRASFSTPERKARVLLQPYDGLAAGDWAQWGDERKKRPRPAPPVAVDFGIRGDGTVRTYRVDLAGKPGYSGGMTQVRIQLPSGEGRAALFALELR
jgi:hypothetical protein